MSVLNQFRLDDRVALVTGGARGIGKAMAAALGQAGAKLAIADLNVEMAEATVTELKEAGHEAFAIKADVADQDSVRAMVASVTEHYGSLDIAFNNAGVNYNSAADTITKPPPPTHMAPWESRRSPAGRRFPGARSRSRETRCRRYAPRRCDTRRRA